MGLAAVARRKPVPAFVPPDADEPPGLLERLSLREALMDAVLELSERQREVVLLRLVEGRSTAEAAELLECAEGTVKATLHQATLKLRAILRGEEP